MSEQYEYTGEAHDYSTYLRFGVPPTTGRSSKVFGLSYAETMLEDGVSVFEARQTERGLEVLVEEEPELDRGLMGSFFPFVLARRPVYLVQGQRIGTGGDGEPLLLVEGFTELEASTPIYASSSHPVVDPWVELYNGWRRGGLMGFHAAYRRIIREGRPRPSLSFAQDYFQLPKPQEG